MALAGSSKSASIRYRPWYARAAEFSGTRPDRTIRLPNTTIVTNAMTSPSSRP
jgi:hypothetical protein